MLQFGDRDARSRSPGNNARAKRSPTFAQALEAEADELRALVGAGEATLAGYRPFAFTYERDDEAPAAALLEAARSLATLRRPTPAQRCQGVRAWADGFRSRAHSFVIPPIHRIASVGWLVHELRRERAA